MKPSFNPEKYETNEGYVAGELTPTGVHTVQEMIALMERDKSIGIDAIVIGYSKANKQYQMKRMGRQEFLESFKTGEKHWSKSSLRESIDAFATDADIVSPGSVGQDFIPLLGGNFYKNLYFYDYIRMANQCFWAAHHDPVGRAYVNLMRDFTLGRGFKIDCKNEAALAVWDAFAEVNNLDQMMDHIARELPAYGETLVWWLPNKQTNIVYRPVHGQEVSKGLLPRVRLIDPTVMWEIVTWPEDITKVLYYVWVAPTAWQMYTGIGDKPPVPTTKFIFQTIPAEQINHYTVNNFVGEKRGRSDLFPALGYMKRLRDSVNYQLIALQKQASWGIDVTVKGSQADVDAYVDAQEAMGTIPPAGSEFVHTEAIQRQYLSPEGNARGVSQSFEWCLSMIATALGIPISYLSTHLSGGQTRATAVVATEPVAKKFEMRQAVYERIIRDMWDRLMLECGLGKVQMNVIFPDLISTDRSQKLKDLALAESQGWISKRRAAEISAKEFGIIDYDFDKEEVTAAPAIPPPPPGLGKSPLTAPPKSGIPSNERQSIKDQNGK
jgi:hypothetical protein